MFGTKLYVKSSEEPEKKIPLFQKINTAQKRVPETRGGAAPAVSYVHQGSVIEAKDMKEVLEENRRLAAFPFNNPNLVLGVEPAGGIVYTNPAVIAFSKKLNLSSLEALFPREHHALLKEVMKSNTSKHVEVAVGEQAFEWLYVPFQKYNVIHLYAREITNQKKLDEANKELQAVNEELTRVGKELVARDAKLSEINQRLVDLDKTKSEFVSVAAHQLRTPVTGIRWTLQALLNRELGNITSEQEKICRLALKNALDSIELINDLLNVARIEEGRFGYELKETSLTHLFQTAVEYAQKSAEKKGIRVSVTKAEIPPFPLDADKMYMVLENLVENAIKYTEAGGEIVMQLVRKGDEAVVVVRDTGVGIPEKAQPHLFTKFFRADNAQLLHTAGSGLGLYIARNIVRHHGGTITFVTKEGKGTTFTITLPLTKVQENKK